MNTTLQYVIVITVVAVAAAYAIYSVYTSMIKKEEQKSHGCSSGCSCESADVKNEVTDKLKAAGKP